MELYYRLLCNLLTVVFAFIVTPAVLANSQVDHPLAPARNVNSALASNAFERLLNTDPYLVLTSPEKAFSHLHQLEKHRNDSNSIRATQRFLAFKIAVHALYSPTQKFASLLQFEQEKLTKGSPVKRFINTQQVILQFVHGDTQQANQTLQTMAKVSTVSTKQTIAALQLFMTPNHFHYQTLRTLCRKTCDSYVYHLSILGFYKANKDVVALEDYAQTLVSRLMNEGVWTDDWSFYRYVLGYLSLEFRLSEKQSKRDAGKQLLESALSSSKPNSYVYQLVAYAADSSR